jgi:hypothetical protein
VKGIGLPKLTIAYEEAKLALEGEGPRKLIIGKQAIDVGRSMGVDGRIASRHRKP